MRNIGKIFWESLKHNPFIWLAVAGAMFVILLTGTTTPDRIVTAESIKVGFLDEDNSPVSENLYQYLSGELGISIAETQDEDELKDLLLNADISAIITVPEKTYRRILDGGDWQIEITTLEDYVNTAYLRAYLETFTSSIEVLFEASGKNQEVFTDMLLSGTQGAKLNRVEFDSNAGNKERQLRCFIQMSGIFAMLSMAVGVFIIMIILDDKQYGTYKRIQLSSIKPVQYILGNALLGILAESVLVLGIVSCYIFLKAEIGISYGLFLVVFLTYGFFSIGLALAIALIAKNRQTALTFIMGFCTISCIWGGAWFPVNDSLGALSKAAMLMPVYWFMQVVRSSVGENTVQVLPAVIILILFTVLTFLIAGVAFARKKD